MDKTRKLLRSIRDILVLILVAILFSTCCNFIIAEANAHETDKYKHQTESFLRYGGGYMWAGIYRAFVNAEQTQCRDLIFNHDLMHITEPFECKMVDGGIKNMEGENK